MRNPFCNFNSSPEVNRLAVMMYVRYPFRPKDLLSSAVSPPVTAGFRWNRFGPLFATEIRKRRVHHHLNTNWCWHLDEVFVRINGETHFLWRAFDHEEEVPEVLSRKRWFNNRAKNSQKPFSRRKWVTARFRCVKTMNKFAAFCASIHNHFNHKRHPGRRGIFKQARATAMTEWC